jgi:hypothetical protein
MGTVLAADDSAILALFHEWQEALGAANSAATDEEAEPLDQRVWRLESANLRRASRLRRRVCGQGLHARPR